MDIVSAICIIIMAISAIIVSILLLMNLHIQHQIDLLNELEPYILDPDITIEELLTHKMPKDLRKKLEELLNETTENHK